MSAKVKCYLSFLIVEYTNDIIYIMIGLYTCLCDANPIILALAYNIGHIKMVAICLS